MCIFVQTIAYSLGWVSPPLPRDNVVVSIRLRDILTPVLRRQRPPFPRRGYLTSATSRLRTWQPSLGVFATRWLAYIQRRVLARRLAAYLAL